ncbi:hypothetical protein [Mycolicibacterium litorale]|uniref:VWFA domain-containing protein n=1 Tax=Mycolicibacterium litorale TaxID=758802 RepID=A0AAD1IW18_9MYCO|nr:hypothetical protein [Mycolicibacterium litorale]MCV7417602.1 hypothetical protein [Mycolicibacterium litorale]TDX99878.1 hypothetical protein BCL50_5331 [Mycolicibacterium litorale]BBY18828.1 hypothetical protein MLIT_44200 [Mycolicibacterium litorale]
MTFEPIIPFAIFAVVAVALVAARLVTLRQALAATGAHRRRALARWAAMTLVVTLLLLACTRPAFTATDDDTGDRGSGANTNVFVLLDRTVDARSDIDALLERYPQARFAVITFAPGPALTWPLSQDVWSLAPAIDAMVPLPPGDPDRSDAAAPGNILRYQLIQATQQYPGSQNLVVYAGAGAPGAPDTRSSIDVPADSVSGGAVLGHPADGAIDEATLRRIADDLGVPYLDRRAGGDLPALETSPDAAEATEPVAAGARTELYWLLCLIAAILLLGEIWLSVRELRQSRVARRDVLS